MKTILLMASTLDGKIAKHKNQCASWTSKVDKKIFIQETKKAGVIIMGKTTYDTIGKPLPGRLNIIFTHNPEGCQNIEGALEFTSLQPRKLLQDLSSRGYQRVILGGGPTINSLFLKENLIDELWLTIEPHLFGKGLSLFKDIAIDIRLELLEFKQLDQNVIHLRYKIVK